MNRIYLVYKYDFDNGEFYYGRTYEGANRFNNSSKYQNQYVYKYMFSGIYKASILMKTTNIFAAYYLEHELISQNALNTKCLNGNEEEDWFGNALRDWYRDNKEIESDTARVCMLKADLNEFDRFLEERA